MKNLILILGIISMILISGCSPKTYSNQQINNPKQITLPIDNANEATQYSLSLEQVRSELNKPLEGQMAEYNKYDWWVQTSKRGPSRNHPIEQEYSGQKIWIINWFKGPGKCKSPHGCQIIIASEGSIVYDLHCNDGWNCK
ncbi:hypothetical protein GOV06_02295 [Candidatus Woesearchaeota archaeon]|nr:hypothetical protein [Candidatus Woesearchaeota archaeon]